MSRAGRVAGALLGVAVLAGSALIAAPADAAAPASATFFKARPVRADSETADATLTYRCQDDATTAYFLRVILTQKNAYYGRGERLAPGPGYLKATCTGKKVTETIVLYTYESSYGTGPLVEGSASLRFELNSRDPQDPTYMGGPGTGPSVAAKRTVKVFESVRRE